MSVDLLLAVAGIIVTVIVVVAMVLITPGGQVDLHSSTESQGEHLSRSGAPAAQPEPAPH